MSDPTSLVASPSPTFGKTYQTISTSGALRSASAAITKVHVLETDGLVVEFLAYLLKMQKALVTRAQLNGMADVDHQPLGLPVVETVVYRNNFPQAWFHWSDKHHQLLKLPGSNLDHEEIYKMFSEHEPQCGTICAQFVWAMAPATDPATIPVARIDYFTPERLRLWLREPNKDGLLQRFIAPRGSHNNVLQFVWTPSVSTLVRKSNIHPIDSRCVAILEKCSTYDGPPHHVAEAHGNELVRAQLEAYVAKFAKVMLLSEHKVISRFVGCFKHDREGVLHMLHATSIRVEHETPIGNTIVRDPVLTAPSASRPRTTVSGSYIQQVLAAGSTLSMRSTAIAAHTSLHFNTVPRQAVLAAGGSSGTISSPSLRQRRATTVVLAESEKWVARKEVHAALPNPEIITALRTFLNEVRYCLFSLKLAQLGGRKAGRGGAIPTEAGAAFYLPAAIADFLTEEQASELMNGILMLESSELSIALGGSNKGPVRPAVCYKPSSDFASRLPPEPVLLSRLNEFIHNLCA